MDLVMRSEQSGQTSDAVEVLVDVTDRHTAEVTGNAGRLQGLLNECAAGIGKLGSDSLSPDQTVKITERVRRTRNEVDSAVTGLVESAQLGMEAAAGVAARFRRNLGVRSGQCLVGAGPSRRVAGPSQRSAAFVRSWGFCSCR